MTLKCYLNHKISDKPAEILFHLQQCKKDEGTVLGSGEWQVEEVGQMTKADNP